MIDAAGTTYVLCGYDGTTYLNDVLKSADGGADRTRRLFARGGAKGYMGTGCRGTLVVPVG